MPRFTLSQMLAAIGFIAIAVLFTQSKGCGARFTRIESMSYSGDDSRILVTKLNARDAEVSGKGLPADISRTISWLDTSKGRRLGIVQQNVVLGLNFSVMPAWRNRRTSAICFGPDDQIAILELGSGQDDGGQLVQISGGKKTLVASVVSGTHLAASKSGRHLAVCGLNEVLVLDTTDNHVVLRVPYETFPSRLAPITEFSTDETRLIVASLEGVHIWDIATSKKLSTITEVGTPDVSWIAAAPDETLVICSDDWFRRYDFNGKVVADLSRIGGGLYHTVSDDGRRLAFLRERGATILDLTSNRLLRTLPAGNLTCVALSSDGSKLAIGDRSGGVSLFDTTSGNRLWYAYPPGRYRLPWTVPLAFLAAWTFIVWRFSKRRPKKDSA